MTFPHRSLSFLLLISLCCWSCSEDPKLVEKREQQKAEIARLKGELALIEEKLKSIPPDVTEQLAEAKAVAEKQTAEAAQLQTEVATLEARKSAIKSEFEAYQAKYQLK